MADKKISEFTDVGLINETDSIPVVRSGANKKAEVGSMAAEDAGDYTPTAGLGSAAFTSSSSYATSTQGAKADTALQPADIGVTVQGYDADTAAIAAISGTAGLLAKTAANTWALRSLTAGGGVGITNGDGAAGNPTFSISNLRTLWVPAGAMVPSVTGGCAEYTRKASGINQPDIGYLAFDPSTEEYVQFSVRLPKGWNHSTVLAQFVWSHPATTTNFGTVWGLQGVSIGDNEAMGVAYGTAQTVADTGGTTDKQYISSATSAITIGGTPADNEVVYFRAYRKAADGSDTMAVDAQLQGIMLYYTISTLDDT